MKITAAVARQSHAPFTIEEVTLSEPRPDEVLVRIVAAGLCHTDLSVRDQMIPLKLPAVLGHEGAGIVERTGSAVTKVVPGDKVLLSFDSCGGCASCANGVPPYCNHFNELNFGGTRRDGSHTLRNAAGPVSGNFFGQSSFATHALSTERNILRVDDDADLAMLAPLGCGIQTGAGAVMNVLDCEEGSSIAIFGGGAVGLSALLAAVLRNCSKIIVVDPVAARRDLAIELGGTHAIDPLAGDVQEAIRSIVPDGVNYAVDTTAVPSALEAASSALAVRGQMVLIGVPAKPETEFRLNVLQSVSAGVTIRGTVEGDSDPSKFIPQLLELYQSGKFPFDRLITLYKFEDINKAIADHHAGACVKAVLRMPDK